MGHLLHAPMDAGFYGYGSMAAGFYGYMPLWLQDPMALRIYGCYDTAVPASRWQADPMFGKRKKIGLCNRLKKHPLLHLTLFTYEYTSARSQRNLPWLHGNIEL